MKEIIKFGKSDTMTSLEIAEVTGKAHKNIMRLHPKHGVSMGKSARAQICADARRG